MRPRSFIHYTLCTMSTQLSMQDKKDLEKFTKYLALRAAQIIVQSRSGQKVNTTCKPDSSAGDWVKVKFALVHTIYLVFIPLLFVRVYSIYFHFQTVKVKLYFMQKLPFLEQN